MLNVFRWPAALIAAWLVMCAVACNGQEAAATDNSSPSAGKPAPKRQADGQQQERSSWDFGLGNLFGRRPAAATSGEWDDVPDGAPPRDRNARPRANGGPPQFNGFSPPGNGFPPRGDDAAPSAGRGRLRFQFHFQPWRDVLDWFAQQADLSLVADAPPPGTFNYTDNRSYTPAEAIDVLNSVLLTKGYTLVRRGRMLMLINLEDGIPANLVTTVPVESLDDRGEFELVRVLFTLHRLKPEDLEAEIKKMLGPQGTVVALSKSQQLYVTDTAGRLRAVRDVLAQMDGTNTSAGGAPQFEVYPIGNSDPQLVLAAVKMLFTSQRDVQLDIDAKTNSLIAMANPQQQASIRAVLAQLRQEGQRVEVLQLTQVEPLVAAQAIRRLFASTDAGKGPSVGPQVDYDLSNRQLLIRGTDAEIAQIRELLGKMGEVALVQGNETHGGRVRTLPMSDAAARTALDKIQEIWPRLRANKVIVVSPPAVIRPAHPAGEAAPPDIPQMTPPSGQMTPAAPRQVHPAAKQEPHGVPRELAPPSLPDRSAQRVATAQILFAATEAEKPAETKSPAAQPIEAKTPPAIAKPAELPPAKTNPSETKTAPTEPAPAKAAAKPAEVKPAEVKPAEVKPAEVKPAEVKPAAPIVVTPGPNGLVIASEDTEALDQFERLLNMLAGGRSRDRGVVVFYLTHAKAASITETLSQMLGGGTMVAQGSLGGRDNGAANSATGAVTATAGPGSSGSVLVTGPVSITADQRLNALFVQANPADVDTIGQLLKVLDQRQSPEEVLVTPRPQMIPVLHTPAEDVADVVRQVYADRMVQSSNSRQPRMPPFMEMFGGRHGRSGGDNQNQQRDDTARMSLGVDTRTNSLIVAAPDALFAEVKQLVQQLDHAAGNESQSVRVVALHHTSPEAVERALAALTGDAVQLGSAAASQSNKASPSADRSQRRSGQTSSSSGSSRQRSRQSSRNTSHNHNTQNNRSGPSFGQPPMPGPPPF